MILSAVIKAAIWNNSNEDLEQSGQEEVFHV